MGGPAGRRAREIEREIDREQSESREREIDGEKGRGGGMRKRWGGGG